MDFSFLEPNEEQLAEMRRRRELYEMAVEEGTQRVNNFLASLDSDDLATLKNMMGQTVNVEGYAVHMMGWIGSLLHFKHGVCPSCGKKHDTMEGLAEAHANSNDRGSFHGD